MSRPTEDPSWCDDDAAAKVVEPSGIKKLQGWIYKERPAFQFWNWVFRNFVKWILHIDVSANQFDPHEAAIPDMTVVITAGRIQAGITLTNVAEQATAAFVAPVGNPRIDRIVIDDITGVYSVIAGTEAASPVAPELLVGKTSICQVLLDNSPATTEITNDLITDERGGKPASQQFIPLDTPLNISVSTAKNSWQTVNNSTIASWKATAVIVRCWIESSPAGTGLTVQSAGIFLRKTGSGLGVGINDGTRIGYNETRTNAGHTAVPNCHGSGIVNLDESFDFDIYQESTGTVVSTANCAVVGYYK